MTFELDCPELVVEREVADKRMKRKDLAITYALAMLKRNPQNVDWARINRAILTRWSESGLIWIKTRAWQIAEGGGSDET